MLSCPGVLLDVLQLPYGFDLGVLVTVLSRGVPINRHRQASALF